MARPDQKLKRSAARRRNGSDKKIVSPDGRQSGQGSSRELIFGDLWEYDPAPETADPRLKKKYDLFINGEFTAPKSGRYFDTINPANEKKLADIALASAVDVDAAVPKDRVRFRRK